MSLAAFLDTGFRCVLLVVRPDQPPPPWFLRLPAARHLPHLAGWAEIDQVNYVWALEKTAVLSQSMNEVPVQVQTKLNVTWLPRLQLNWYFHVDKPLCPELFISASFLSFWILLFCSSKVCLLVVQYERRLIELAKMVLKNCARKDIIFCIIHRCSTTHAAVSPVTWRREVLNNTTWPQAACNWGRISQSTSTR